MTRIQAVLFKHPFPPKQKALWMLKELKVVPIKPPHYTDNYMWFWIIHPDYNKHLYRIKKIKNAAYDLIIQI